MFLEKAVLNICSKFTGEHPCLSVISLHICRTSFPKNTSGWLLLSWYNVWKYWRAFLKALHHLTNSNSLIILNISFYWGELLTSWTHEVNWTYIRCSEDGLNFNLRPVPRGSIQFLTILYKYISTFILFYFHS